MHLLHHHIVTHVVIPALVTLALSAAVAQHNIDGNKDTRFHVLIVGKLPKKGPVK
jgi:hypothetical protein